MESKLCEEEVRALNKRLSPTRQVVDGESKEEAH